jgi:GWxTD domain-containing protein
MQTAAMKKATLIFLFLFSLTFSQAQLKVHMKSNAFKSPVTDSPYVETAISIPARFLQIRQIEPNQWHASVEILLLYLRDTNIIAYDKYILKSPAFANAADADTSTLLDLRRLNLPNGEYSIFLHASDVNRNESQAQVEQGLRIEIPAQGISISDIELVDSYTATQEKTIFSKNGFDILPRSTSFFSQSHSTLQFYAEIYGAANAGAGEDILINYYLTSTFTDSVIDNRFRRSRQKAADVNFLFSSFDITTLPTGNYVLHVEVRNKLNQLLAAREIFLQRMNQESSGLFDHLGPLQGGNMFTAEYGRDSLLLFTRSLHPLAESYEQNFIDRALLQQDEDLLRRFFYNFWLKRNPADPQHAWKEYQEQVNLVNTHYSTPIDEGFETDRGRVYLQYGSPNAIEKRDRQAGAYPYEIWHYYQLPNRQTNVRFVFCNSDLVTNDFALIHSDAIGEIYDSRWKFKVYETFKGHNNYSDLDETDFRNVFGGTVEEDFDR